MVKPKASSTPKLVNISSRRPIGEINNDSEQSPIFNHKYNYAGLIENRTLKSNSDEESDHVDSNDETENITEERITNTTFCNCVTPSFFVIVTVGLLLVATLYHYSEEQNKVSASTLSSQILSREFPSQVEDFWLYIEEGIKDIQKFHKPKSFIFVYNDESRETLKKILHRITEFATCSLTYCTALPVILEGKNLNANILRDYGEIIVDNKEKLEQSGVMIVKNLEKVSGVSAQAFHSFCDEYNPVVEKALFIFAVKVDDNFNNDLKYVEKLLHNRWKDIEDDKFYPLFTRIANVVLPIVAENGK